MKTRKAEFETVDADGKTIRLAVCRPTARQKQDAELAKAVYYAKLVQGGAILRAKVVDVAREQHLWTEAKEKDYQDTWKAITDQLKKLPDGSNKVREKGVSVKVAYRAALEVRALRRRLNAMLGERMTLDALSAEKLADDVEFDHLMSVCTVWAGGANEGEPYFASVEDYQDRKDEAAAAAAAAKLSEFVFNLDPKYQHQLPENQFLVKHGFADGETLAVAKDEDGKPFVEAKEELFDLVADATGPQAATAPAPSPVDVSVVDAKVESKVDPVVETAAGKVAS